MSPILEVLIGMVFVFSLLSILVTQINKLLSASLRLRAKHLRGAFDEIIHDEALRAKVVAHPLINLMDSHMILPNQRLTEEQVNDILGSAVNAVEWVDPQTFVSVLTTVIEVDSDEELYAALLDVVDKMPDGEERRRLRRQIDQVVDTGQGVDELKTMIADLSEVAHRNALVKMINDITAAITNPHMSSKSNVKLIAGLRKIDNVYFRESMKAILASSETVMQAEAKIAKWFDDAMYRTTAAFKSTMVYLSLAVSCVIAVVLNVDSLHIAQTLWDDPALRETLNQTIEATDIQALREQADAALVDNISTDDANLEDETEPTETIQEVEEAGIAVVETLGQLSDLRLPIGWSFENLGDGDIEDENFIGNSRYLWNYVPWHYENWWQLLFLKLVGIGGTMIAIAQGAPFWFGILARLSGGSST